MKVLHRILPYLPFIVLAAARALAAEHGVPVVVDPVSVPKAARLAEEVRDLLAVTPSHGELEALGRLFFITDEKAVEIIEAVIARLDDNRQIGRKCATVCGAGGL